MCTSLHCCSAWQKSWTKSLSGVVKQKTNVSMKLKTLVVPAIALTSALSASVSSSKPESIRRQAVGRRQSRLGTGRTSPPARGAFHNVVLVLIKVYGCHPCYIFLFHILLFHL